MSGYEEPPNDDGNAAEGCFVAILIMVAVISGGAFVFRVIEEVFW